MWFIFNFDSCYIIHHSERWETLYKLFLNFWNYSASYSNETYCYKSYSFWISKSPEKQSFKFCVCLLFRFFKIRVTYKDDSFRWHKNIVTPISKQSVISFHKKHDWHLLLSLQHNKILVCKTFKKSFVRR